MSKVAILIGVSRYPPDLNSLPRAQKDVEVMKRVLKQPQFGFEVAECLCNASLQETEVAIETFFKNRASDDQVLFLFSGYGIQDEEGRLYFATPETAPDSQGRLIKAKAIPASFIDEAMNSSPAQQQVVILDCYFRQKFGGDSIVDENPVDLPAQLGGEGRVILTASVFTHHLNEPSDLDAWGYARYIAEGIETAAADIDCDGTLSAEDLHDYAKKKLKVAAPAMQPQIYGSEKLFKQPLLQVPVRDSRVSYRKVLEEVLEDLTEQGETDVTGTALLKSRTLLDDIKHSLGLSYQEAEEIELQSLRPLREYRQRRQSYQEKFSATKLGDVNSNNSNNQDLRRVRQALGLTDDDTAGIEAAPQVAEQQQQREQYQRSLAKYEQVLLAVMQRQFPVAEGDRRLLQHLKAALQIKDEDANTIEMELASQLNRRGASSGLQDSSTSETQPPVELSSNQQRSTMPSSPRPVFMPSEQAQPAGDTGLPPNLVNVSYSQPEANPRPEQPAGQRPIGPPPGPAPVHSVDAASSSLSPNSRPEVPPSKSVPEPVVTNPKDPRTWPIGAFIVPALLLAAIIGTVVAIWSSRNLGNPFNPTPPSPPAISETAQTPIKQAADDINLGVQTHEVGRDVDAAINYYNEAINLLKSECQPASVGSSPTTQCQMLARAYSNRSYAHFDLSNYSQALNDANSAVVMDPNLPEAWINRANARFKQGDTEGALQDYNQALQLNLTPALQAGVYNNQGNILFAQNDAQSALNDYTQAINSKSNYADAYFNRGLAYEKLKDPASAASDFQRAAQFYRDQNNFQLAQEAEKKAADLQKQVPSNTPLPPSNSPS